MHEDILTNKNAKQDMEMKTQKNSYSPGKTDAKDYRTCLLHDIKIEEAVITSVEQTSETDADTPLKNGNKMSKQSENKFDEQKEEAIEAKDLLKRTQRESGMEFIYTKGKYGKK